MSMAVTMLGTPVHFTAAIAMSHFFTTPTASSFIALLMHLLASTAAAAPTLLAFTAAPATATSASTIIPSGDGRNAERETCGQRQ
jgi:hypothetical protein